MKKIVILVGVVMVLASRALAQAPAGVYGTGNIIFPGDPAAAAAAGAYARIGTNGPFEYGSAWPRTGNCVRRYVNPSYGARPRNCQSLRY